MKGHVNLDELYRQAARFNSRIGYTTVYRTLKLLTECGMAVERKFADGQTRYENVDQGEHHDHLICLSCGKILEFTDNRIEKMQEEIAARHHFAIKDHRLEIYGACADCLKKEKNPPSPPFSKGRHHHIPPLEKGDTGGFSDEKAGKK